jgi:C-terminal processing protease CtpA/Prc
MISRVVPGSAAEAAGLAVGDIITAVGDDDVSSSSALGRSMRSHEGGELLSIEFWRNGSSHQATATLEEQERCALDVGEFMEGFDFAGLSELGLGISEEVMKGLHEALEGQDWGQHFEALKHLNLEGLKSLEGLKVLEGIEGLEGLEILEGLEERMERVQERLKHLEQDLEREVGRKVEREVEQKVKREVEREVRQEKRNRERDLHRAERDRRLKEGIDLEEDGEKSAEDLGTLKL